MRIREMLLAIGMIIVISACGEAPKIGQETGSMACDIGTCTVTIDVENESTSELPLIYEISLHQNNVHDPNRRGLRVVGEANGEITLLAGEHRILDVEVKVSEEPNGSKVVVFDSRMPKFIRSMMEI